MGDVCIDTITNRPRTPNDQYTFLSDEQIGNIKQNTSTFFDVQKGDPSAGIYTPKEGGRFYRDRYTDITSQHLTRVPNASQAFGWINFQHNRFPPEQYNTCRERASVRWGPNKAGERTRSHYFGEDPERYTTIDMYRRNPTTYAGRVVMDCGRPGDGYYAQKFPDRTTWFGSNVPLNRTNIMESVYQKTMAEYEEIKEAEKTARLARQEQWPEYSEYTDKFLLATKTQQTLSPLEEKKRYSQSAKTTREGTVKKMDDTCTGEKQTAPNSAASHRPLSTEKL